MRDATSSLGFGINAIIYFVRARILEGSLLVEENALPVKCGYSTMLLAFSR